MATLGSVYHDFPLLAKQSGFYFQLHTGRVNWSEIENLDVNEIIEKRNFRLLEDNLINVINCNLEREYDLKILDPNFIKLFKLAQLGVDYLSYCEIYLDKCVVLLQEQLTAFQEEFDSLRQENEKRKEEQNRNKKKNKTPSHQCEKCEKVFISDVYLKYHDKRRHSSPNTPKSSDTSQKMFTDSWQQTELNTPKSSDKTEKRFTDSGQQTEDESKSSTSTQTAELNEQSRAAHEEKGSLKNEYTTKIENLEEELKDLKEHLKKAESFLTQKTEPFQSNVFHSLNVPGPICYNPMLMLLPSYLQQSGSEINPAPQVPVQPEFKPDTTISSLPGKPQVPVTIALPQEKPDTAIPSLPDKPKPVEPNHQLQTSSRLTTESEKDFSKKESKFENTGSFQEYQTAGKETFENDKENVNPNTNILTNGQPIQPYKPLPPPRKLKKGTPTQNKTEAIVSNTKTGEEEPTGFASRSILYRSTPIKKAYEESDSDIFDAHSGNLSEINKIRTNSTESLDSRKSAAVGRESESIIKKLVTGNSPKLRRFSKNIKRSLTNIYDSVSSNEKDSSKSNLRDAMTSKLNGRLRQMGVDPEWDGIPKKTFKEKLKDLKYHQKLLTKENPMYPVIRRNIEEKIFLKLKTNLGKKKARLMNKLSKQKSMDIDDSAATEDILLDDKPDFVKVKNSVMYDIDSDSESKTSVSEKTPERNNSPKSVVLEELSISSETEEKLIAKKDREFDFSVFQVGGGSSSVGSLQKQCSFNNGELSSDSDTDDDFPKQSNEKLLKALGEGSEKQETARNHESPGDRFKFSSPGKTKSENHSILKEKHPKPPTSGKKKVLFANYSNGIEEEELSDSPLDDDLWPFKSDSEKDVG